MYFLVFHLMTEAPPDSEFLSIFIFEIYTVFKDMSCNLVWQQFRKLEVAFQSLGNPTNRPSKGILHQHISIAHILDSDEVWYSSFWLEGSVKKMLTPGTSNSNGSRAIVNFRCQQTPQTKTKYTTYYPARARSARARRACALRALGLLLADGAPTVGWGKTFWRVGRVPPTKTGVTRKRKIAQ